MTDPRYFGIALTLDELHKSLGLPEDVKIYTFGYDKGGGRINLTLESSGSYDGMTADEYYRNLGVLAFFRPDIQTRTVSQVLIHPLKEK
jgi:hypothetical protein